MVALKTLTSKGFNQFPGSLSGKEGPVSGPSRLPDVKPPCLNSPPGFSPGGFFFADIGALGPHAKTPPID